MRFLILGDTHFTNTAPGRRIDESYLATQMMKVTQVAEIYHERHCDCLIQPGDFFDSPRVSNEAIAAVVDFLRAAQMEVLCVYGQHDIAGHSESTFVRSPLRVLEAAGVVKILDNSHGTPLEKGVVVYGASFGQEVKRLSNTVFYPVLVTHQMVGDNPLYPGHDIMHPMTFLRKHKDYRLIICGDYHYRFAVQSEGRWCVNSGAMVRKTIAKQDLEHRPAVILVDTDPRGPLSPEVIELDVQPVEDVFDLSIGVKTAAHDSQALAKFLENLKEVEGCQIGWKEVLLRLYEEKKTPDNIRELISECIEEMETEE